MVQDPKRPETIPSGPAASFDEGFRKTILVLTGLVRTKLRDHEELNRLVAGRESSDRQIAFALMETVDDWNSTPPLIETVTLEGFPHVACLINGAVGRILRSVALLQVRNHMSYSDGQGVRTSSSDKGPLLQQWATMFLQEYEQKKQRLKMAMNLAGAMNGTGISSEYRYLNALIEDGTLE